MLYFGMLLGLTGMLTSTTFSEFKHAYKCYANKKQKNIFKKVDVYEGIHD